MDDEQGRILAFPQAPEAIELRHLRSFVAVAEDLNFGRAAARLYLSQPALSRQISALEKLVGCELLRRSTHRVELTLAGEALLDRARLVLADVDEAVSAAQAVGGELVARVARLWEPVVDAGSAEHELEELRAAYEGMHAQFSPPPDIDVLPVNANGVAAFTLTARPDQPVTLLYVHGGGYALGSAYGYRPIAGALAAASDTGALIVEYRLVPEHPFPAALDDCLRAYEWILERGTEPEHVTVAGDSSGGGLAVSVLMALRERRLPMPGGAVLFCPWVDLTGGTLEQSKEDVPVAAFKVARGFADAYLDGHPIDDPVVSPLTADLSGLPPLLIQAATGDAQLEDSKLLADRARAHGVDVRLELYPVDTHVFQIFWSFLPEAVDAIGQAGQFVQGTRATAGERRAS